MKKIIFITAVFLVLGSTPAKAEYADIVPYQISLFHPLQTTPEGTSICGIRMNLISAVNEDVSGLDIGMFNLINDVQKGLQFGIYNRSFKTSGVQLGLINKTSYLDGLQIGLLNFHEEGNLKLMPIINFSF